MYRLYKSKSIRIRLGIYLAAVLLISTPYWLGLRQTQLIYSAVKPDGSFDLKDQTRKTATSSVIPLYLIDNDKLYLLTEKIAPSPLNPFRSRRTLRNWTGLELHDLASNHPELQSYLTLLPPRLETIRIQLK